MNFNRLFDKRFRGQPLLASMRDQARDRTLKLFYIEHPTLVGVHDGVDVWVSPVKGCFKYLKEGLLESQMLLAIKGELAPEVPERKKLVLPVQRKVLQHRESTHAN